MAELNSLPTLLADAVAYWRAEDNGNDSSPNSNTLTLQGGAGYAAGKYGQALDLELSTSDFAEANDSASLSFVGDFSISCWINLEQLASTIGAFVTMVSKHSNTDNQRTWIFNIRNALDRPHLIFWSNGAGASLSRFESTTPIVSGDLGNWVHMVVTVDVSVPSAKFYIDGDLKTTNTITTNATSMSNTTSKVHVGATISAGTESAFLDGLMDDVAIWDKIISQADVDSLFEDALVSALSNPMFFSQQFALG